MKDIDEREGRCEALKGLGCSRKRVEDARFTQKARAAMSTTSPCPACRMAISCAPLMPMHGRSTSTPMPQWPCPAWSPF